MNIVSLNVKVKRIYVSSGMVFSVKLVNSNVVCMCWVCCVVSLLYKNGAGYVF